MIIALAHTFFLFFFLVRWFIYEHENQQTDLRLGRRVYLKDDLRRKNKALGLAYGMFGMGIVGIFLVLPISILLSPFFLAYVIYTICYWSTK